MAKHFEGPTQIDHLVPIVLTGLGKNFEGPTQIDQLVPIVLTGLDKNFEGPTQIDQLVPIVLTGFSISGGPTTGTNWYMVSGTNRCPPPLIHRAPSVFIRKWKTNM